MENKRLTYKLNEQEQEEHKTKYLKFKYFPIPDYCIEKGNYGRITSDMIYNKLGKLEDLEDRFGCSLDIMFKALINGIYTKESEADKLELFEVRGIEKDGLSVISKLCSYAECDFSCKFKDYKKTWWLKADRSE